MKSFNLVTLYDLVTVFAETKTVTKSRLHCNYLAHRIQHSTQKVLRILHFHEMSIQSDCLDEKTIKNQQTRLVKFVRINEVVIIWYF